jgi:glycosyltransferase involved in cell wall biosynthesis
MALECPAVVTATAGSREVADGDTAVLVSVDDRSALAAGIAAVLSDPAAAAARAARARARFESAYTIEAIADRMAAWYERALAEASRR